MVVKLKDRSDLRRHQHTCTRKHTLTHQQDIVQRKYMCEQTNKHTIYVTILFDSIRSDPIRSIECIKTILVDRSRRRTTTMNDDTTIHPYTRKNVRRYVVDDYTIKHRQHVWVWLSFSACVWLRIECGVCMERSIDLLFFICARVLTNVLCKYIHRKKFRLVVTYM